MVQNRDPIKGDEYEETLSSNVKLLQLSSANESLSGDFKLVKQKNNYRSCKEHVNISKTAKFEGSKFKSREDMIFRKCEFCKKIFPVDKTCLQRMFSYKISPFLKILFSCDLS